MDNQQYISVKEAKDVLNISQRQVYRYIKGRKLTVNKDNNLLYFYSVLDLKKERDDKNMSHDVKNSNVKQKPLKQEGAPELVDGVVKGMSKNMSIYDKLINEKDERMREKDQIIAELRKEKASLTLSLDRSNERLDRFLPSPRKNEVARPLETPNQKTPTLTKQNSNTPKKRSFWDILSGR